MATKIHIVQKFYILNERNEVEQTDIETWKKWFATHDRKIDADVLPSGICILTIFIGKDPTMNTKTPLVFETKVFPDTQDLSQIEVARHSTYDEALVGHKRMLEKWKKLSPKLPN